MQLKRINTLFLSLAVMLVATGLKAQRTVPLSAKEAVDFAMKNNVQVKNAIVSIAIQQQQNREITAAALPQVDGNVAMTDYLAIPTNLLPAEFFGGAPGTYLPVKFGTKFNGSYGANLRQILFDGQVFVGLQARTASIKYATQNVDVTKEQIKANVYKVYYQLVVGKVQVKILEANISRAEKLLRDTKELFKNGFAERLDVDKVTVNISNLNTEKTKVLNQLETGNIGLKYLMGFPVKDQVVLTDSLRDENLKDDVLDAGDAKYDDRIEYRLLQTVSMLNKYNIKRYQMSYLPSLNLNVGYTSIAQRNTFNFFKSGEKWFPTSLFSLSLNIPIFDGFARDARIKQARLALEQTINNLADLKNNIDNEILTAKVSIRNAIITLDEQKNNMELAEKVYNQTKLKYEQGLGSNLEVTNAETDLTTAQNNYFSAKYDAIIAKIDYLKATGKL
jgi:outer membrane protein